MKTKIFYLMVILASLLTLCSCNNGDGDEFLGSKSFTFNTAIDSSTLTQEADFRVHNTEIAQREEYFSIESDAELDALNQTLDANDQVSLPDLDTFTYFFIRDPDCPEYYDYSSHSYNNNVLTINFFHFHDPPGTACPAWITELYVVFKAEKTL